MTQFSNTPVVVDGVQVYGVGVTGEARAGAERSARSRELNREVDPFVAALAGVEGLEVRSELTVEIQSAARGISREGGVPFDQTPSVRLTGPPTQPGEQAQIVITEEDGYYNFILPVEGTRDEFEIPVDADTQTGDRALLGRLGQMAIRVIGVAGARKVVEKATELAVRRIEGQRRPHRLRSFAPAGFTQEKGGQFDLEKVEPGPSLLLIHGTNSSSHAGFRFSRPYMERLYRRYSGGLFAFDHPSLSYSPKENAEWLVEYLDDKGVQLGNVDILAHSRGGLVARYLIEQIRTDRLDVRSVLFVATPNAGTPLADGKHLGQFISLTTNLLNVLPDNVVTDGITIGLELLKEFVLGAAFEAIEGVAAMNPGGDFLARMNANTRPDGVTYRAIAANFEPGPGQGALSRARDFAMDTVFLGRDNDLVVPTRSAYAKTDAFHVDSDARLVLGSSYGVDHSSFWNRDLVLDRFDQWLDPGVSVDDATSVPSELTDPIAEFEQALDTGDIKLFERARSVLSRDQRGQVVREVGGEIAPASRGETATKGTVIVIPGIMGSNLDVDGRPVWANKWQLLRGRFAHLAMDGRNRVVEARGLMKQYAPLVSHLTGAWRVVTHPYDWRRDIREAADQLAQRLEEEDVGIDGWEVHFIAHSMGGLVMRAFMARHHELWKRARGRLIQLGTPNWGSFAIPNAFLGADFMVRALAFADPFHTRDEVVGVIASFPGSYQLLPSAARTLPDGDSHHERIYEAAVWRNASIRQDMLDDARKFHEELSDAIDTDRIIYVAGDRRRTPHRLHISDDGAFSIGITERGDGRVPHDFGWEGLGLKKYFADAKHGDLASDPAVLQALDDLLTQGGTSLLAPDPAVRRGDAADVTEWVPVEEVELRLGNHTAFAVRGAGAPNRKQAESVIDQAIGVYVGGGETPIEGVQPIRVKVVHGSLEHARYPVAVGWYKGLPSDGALNFLNLRMGGVLGAHEQNNLYPEEGGTAIYVAGRKGSLPSGAIVLGLGEFGELTPTRLTAAMEEGAVRYALEAVAMTSPGAAKPTLGVASVLVGAPGRYGLGVGTVISSLITGVARAAVKLADVATLAHFEIIELHEGVAEQAAVVLNSIAEPPLGQRFDVPIEAEPALETRPGGLPGVGEPEESGPAWPRVELRFEERSEPRLDPRHQREDRPQMEKAEPGSEAPEVPQRRHVRRLSYVGLTRRAQADRFHADVDEGNLQRLVRMAVSNSSVDSQINNTLYELLFPNEAKFGIDELDNLHLLVDESTAWIPWEVLAGRDRLNTLQPLAIRTGVLRQLKPSRNDQRRPMPGPIGKHALVIGDPPAGDRFPRLPGARREASRVADILGAATDESGYEVTRRIFGAEAEPAAGQASEILNDFFAKPYRIIHIAAHGVFEPGSVDGVGAVIGEGELLSSLEFRQRSSVPDLVFLNCCHIGRIDDYDPSALETQRRFADLAASVSLELMRCGVKAVVAAGWAVDDLAAEAFSTTFYERMVAGETFGEAVHQARRAANESDAGRSNTWGAYQCYGDPGFQFYGTERPRRERQVFISANHLVTYLKEEEIRATTAGDVTIKTIVERLEQIEETLPGNYATGPVFEALGDSYYELGRFDDAIYCYRRALKHESAAVSLRAIERLANIEARFAAHLVRVRSDGSDTRTEESPARLFESAQSRVDWLMSQGKTPERHVICGSFHKKRAAWQPSDELGTDDLIAALEHYDEAARLSQKGDELDVYHADLAIQMASLLHSSGAKLKPYKTMLAQLEKQVEEIDETVGAYFDRARKIDAEACGIVFGGKLSELEKQRVIIDGFRQKFDLGSSRRQRLSVIDHYRDLAKILGRHPEREGESAGAAAIAKELELAV